MMTTVNLFLVRLSLLEQNYQSCTLYNLFNYFASDPIMPIFYIVFFVENPVCFA